MSEQQFWNTRPHLTTIHQYAQARRVGPWAVLGTVLARVIAATSPTMQLPPLVGGYGSLNFFVAIVAPSGGGKGTAQTTGTDVLQIDGGEPFPVKNLGSGEGIVHSYVRWEKIEKDKPAQIVQHENSVLFSVAEIDTFAAIARRQGATLAGEIRKLWSGEALGFQNADEARRLNLDAHTYRATLIAGVQPGRGAALLDDADGGTPQRFIWLPALDPTAPDTPPALPEPIRWSPPQVRFTDGRQVLDVAEQVRQVIDHHRTRTLRGETIDLDGHALFSRLKIAAALALLDNRTAIFGDDWELAGQVMARSDRTRAEIADYLAHAKAQRNAEQAQARGHATAIAAETAADRFMKRAKDSIMRTLTKQGEPVNRTTITRNARSDIRPHLDAALAELEQAGEIVSTAIEYQGQPGFEYRLT